MPGRGREDYFFILRASIASPVKPTANMAIVLPASGTERSGMTDARSGLAAKEDWQSKAKNAQTDRIFFI